MTLLDFRIIQYGIWKDPEGEFNSTEQGQDNLRANITLKSKKKSENSQTFVCTQDAATYPDWRSTLPVEIELGE